MQFSSMDRIETYKFARLIAHDSYGVYTIEKITVEIDPVALKNIQQLLLSGEIWVRKGKTFAAVGVDEQDVKHVLIASKNEKGETVHDEEGKVVYKDIKENIRVRELTQEETEELSKLIEVTIQSLNPQNNIKSSRTSEIQSIDNKKVLKSTLSRSSPRGKPKPALKSQLLKASLAKNTELMLAKKERRRKEERDRQEDEKKRDLKSRLIKKDQKEWDREQSDIKKTSQEIK